jgi:hypothetical protein
LHLFWPTLVFAGNVYIQKGEGGAGLDAWFDLEESEQLSLAMMDCRKTGKKFNIGVGVFVGATKAISGNLQKLLNHELND